ncbi:MAG TPA: tRNA 2-thiouridine(34) synthase MnmA, partial [Clostridiales bacterium]|nr:tRNA 2-thiouridine(34) synthase MnmA [Clostridiales bacterium]
VTLKMFNNYEIGIDESLCCSLEDVEDARNVAHSLGIPYYVYNFTEEFKENVIDRFVDAYINGRTPNPCIDCNRFIKFKGLIIRARQLMFDYVVTGHYAIKEWDDTLGRFLLKKAFDET